MDRYAQTEDNMIAFPSQTIITCMHWSKKNKLTTKPNRTKCEQKRKIIMVVKETFFISET